MHDRENTMLLRIQNFKKTEKRPYFLADFLRFLNEKSCFLLDILQGYRVDI